MRKQTSKRASSLPPVREEDISRAIREWKEAKSEITELGVSYLSHWSERLKNTNLLPDFRAWLNRTAEKIKDPLEDLCIKHSIPPEEILEPLTCAKIVNLMWHPNSESELLFRSGKKRERAAMQLDRAAEILRAWESWWAFEQIAAMQWALSPNSTHTLADQVQEAAQSMRKLGAPQAHRPRETMLRSCALSLARVFFERTGTPRYESIGQLMHAAFSPKIWNPVGDLKEATKKLFEHSQLDRFLRIGGVDLEEEPVELCKHVLYEAKHLRDEHS